MNKMKVMAYLNSLDVVEQDGGEEAYALVEVTEQLLTDLEELGVDRETFLQYGDEDHVCIIAYAFSEGLATHYDGIRLVAGNTYAIQAEAKIKVYFSAEDNRRLEQASEGRITEWVDELRNVLKDEIASVILAGEQAEVEVTASVIDLNKEEEETITVPVSEYIKLGKRGLFLSALEAAGVDNWDGYGVAHDILEEWEREDGGEANE